MKKISLVVAILLSVALPLQAGEIERIKEKGEIVVSLNKGYPPFSITEGKEIIGLDADMGRLIANYLGVRMRFVLPDLYKDQIPRLLAGESDIIIAAMTRTVERGLKVNFTEPYFEVSQAALADRKILDKTDNSYFDLVDIKNIRVGMKENTTIERFARELFPASSIKAYPTHPDAADALVSGKVDAMLADSPFVRVWVKSHPLHVKKIKPLLVPVTKEYYGFAIRKGDPDFLNWLNLFITQIKTDGTMALLKHKYFTEMAWLGMEMTGEAKLTKAQLLRNKFIFNKNKMLDKKLIQEKVKAGDAYE
ncbi:transporter substrate-binding domain-containing protein [Desulfobacterales bacterium HSG2]|nr:transporter substrate-binding domain-containing protein [Desulfobacterales bacterium HSG2]